MTAYPVIAPGDARPANPPPKSNFFQYGFADHEWDDQTARQPWSLSSPAPDTLRLELRSLDQTAFDISAKSGSERAQLDTRYDGANQNPKGPGRPPIRTPVHVKYGMTIQPGATITSPWFVLTQLHEDQVTGSPPIAVELLPGNIMTINKGWTDPATGKSTNGPIWKDTAPLERGRRYQMEQRMFVDPDGQGRIMVWRDGVLLVDHTGPVGYQGQTTSFWAMGAYRHGPTSDQTFVVDYDNVTFEWGAGVTMGPAIDAHLSKQTGPFTSDAGSFRAWIAGQAEAGASLAATLNGQPFNPNNLVVAADGSYTMGPIRVPADGSTVAAVITATTSDGSSTAALTFKVVDGALAAS